jgi:hypothetical protein
MLFVLIPIAWLAVVTLFLGACRAAARADALALAAEDVLARADASPVMRFRGLTVWEQGDPVRLRRIAASLSARPAGSGRPLATRRVGAARGGSSRVRGAHAVGAPTPTS